TGVVAYKTNGTNSNNDIINDGIRNGSACAAAGYAYVDAYGMVVSCPVATTTTSTTTTTSHTSSSGTTSTSTSTSSSTSTSRTSSTATSSSTSTTASTSTSTSSSTSTTESTTTSTSTRPSTTSSTTPPTCNNPGSLCQTPSASGCTGATSLPVFNPTHYEVQIGTTITGKIIGATDLTGAETCSSGGSGVDVIVKSSNFGNTTLCGTLSGCPGPACTITYTYNAPLNGCETGVVAYKINGNNSNNDIIDDGIKNGSACAAAGYAYVDA